jgi:Zn-dependent M28 family amino/carboxypeptidase
VIGVIPGADPALAGEAVLVGAHYDHVGRGDEGGVIDGPGLHPGADDNASGIAALLAAAGELAAGPRPRRSILFVAFTGEERGLVGSIVAAARAPRSVVAMVNFDMVGRMRDRKLEVQGAPTSPAWRDIVEAANGAHLALAFPPRVSKNSDHAPFIAAGVPALLLHTGMHGDYHRKGDTAEKINADGIVETARLATRVVRTVADRPGRLAFVGPLWTTSLAGGRGAP